MRGPTFWPNQGRHMRAASSVAAVYELNSQPMLGDSGIHGHCILDASGGPVRFVIDLSHNWKNRTLWVALVAKAGATAGHPLANPHLVYPAVPATPDSTLVVNGLFCTGGGWDETTNIKNATTGCWADSTDLNTNDINFKVRLYALTTGALSPLKVQATTGVWTINYSIACTEEFN